MREGARVSRRFLILLVIVSLIGAYLSISAPPAAAEDEFKPRGDIIIKNDDHFDAAHGVVSGSGSPTDPYVIEGWQVRRIELADTDSAVVIRDNAITSQLILNWNGPYLTVVNNRVNDLRVNQNVKRTGAATGGLIADNSFGLVGQLRHFDGVFENNTVKPGAGFFDPLPLFGPGDAVTFDGFNGAIFRNNTIYGPLDVKLHGHHHGSDFGAPSHQHAAGHNHHMDMDHTKRYHRVLVKNNTIHSTGAYALRWTDNNHSGDDRTAPSEQNEELNKPHEHWTRVALVGNKLIGSGLSVQIFNADDRNHLGTNRGSMSIRDNVITLERADLDMLDTRYGIQVWDATDLNLEIIGNQIISEIEESAASGMWQRTAGIELDQFDLADIYLADNQVSNTHFGIRASSFTESVHWAISGLTAENVEQDVYYDDSVSNAPERSP